MAKKRLPTRDPVEQFKGVRSTLCPTYDVPTETIRPNGWNPNTMSQEQLDLLMATIQEHGWDQPCVVVPAVDEAGEEYLKIIKGEHRWRQSVLSGSEATPVVFRIDWDDYQQRIQTVRDNELRGSLDRRKFTALVNEMKTQPDVTTEDLARDMGFMSEEDFQRFYVQERSRERKREHEVEEDRSKREIYMVDDLTVLLNEIFLNHGSTASSGYMFFMHKGKEHLLVEVNPRLAKALERLKGYLAESGEDAMAWFSAVIEDGLG